MLTHVDPVTPHWPLIAPLPCTRGPSWCTHQRHRLPALFTTLTTACGTNLCSSGDFAVICCTEAGASLLTIQGMTTRRGRRHPALLRHMEGLSTGDRLWATRCSEAPKRAA